MPNYRAVGRDAEDLAADYLIANGFTIITRRFKCRRGELDLVALDGEELVFVEVKQRGTGAIPEEAVGQKKIELLRESATEYLQKMDDPERVYRFDLLAIERDQIRHIRNAFQSWQ